ncbi:MAG: NAD(+) kinase [Thermoplasmata archaeon]
MKFGIVANTEITRSFNIVKLVYEYLRKEHDVILEEKTAKKIQKTGIPISEMDVDMIITIGGDGTVLKTLQNTTTPIFSINLGKLGFLTEIVPVDLESSLERLINGNYFLDRRKKIKVLLNDKRLPDCANEAVIHTAEISKLRTYAIYIDKELLEDLRADGLIIATATGSTSYALSTGGPIVDPRIDAMVIAYIAPFKLSIRSHVVPSKSELEIHLLDKNRKSVIVLDGQIQKRITHNDVVKISESEKEAVFVRFNLNFYEKLREKIL